MLTSTPQFNIAQSTPIRAAAPKVIDEDEVVPEADVMLEDAEESFLQEAIQNELDNVETEPNASENENHDHYKSVSYGNITDEIIAVSEPKCIATIKQLKVLLGDKCRP